MHACIGLFETKKEKLGFPQVEVVPVFYTPFAPHAYWHGIQLISSRYLLSMYLFKFFKPKEPQLVKKDERLRRLVTSENYPIPYLIDAHDLDPEIDANTRRVQDGLFVGYNESDVDVEIQNPIGHSFFVTFEVNKETMKELKKQKIVPGMLIRMGLVNLSGSWSILQMLYFQKINAKDPKRKIMEIWGKSDESEEIIGVFEKHNLDFFKFIEFCKARTPLKEYSQHMLAARMGTVLAFEKSFSFIGQCPCGQIMGFPKEQLELRKKIGYGRVLCRACLEALRAG